MTSKDWVSTEKQDKNSDQIEELNYPKIRFNFEGKWVEKSLRDICSFYKGKGISKNDISSEGVSCIRYGELYTTYDELISEVNSKTNLPENELILSEKNDILMPCSGETAIDLATASCILEEGVAIGGDITIIKTNQYAPFITYYLNVKKNEIAKYAQGVSIVHLYSKDFQNLKIKIPSFKEQLIIVNLLKKLQKKIDLMEKKYTTLQKYKNGLMQKIFENKIGFSLNDWIVKKLNEITFFQEGPGVRNYQYTKEGVRLLNVGNFVKNEIKFNTDRHISEEEAYGKYKHFLVDEGDLLIACSGIKAEYFNEKIAFAKSKHLPLCMNTSTMRFKSLNTNFLSLYYLKYFLQTEIFKKQVFKVLTGSAQFNFGPTHIKYFRIPIPPLEEQEKIADFLSEIDNKIDSVEQQLEKIKEFKKYLLQQMFV